MILDIFLLNETKYPEVFILKYDDFGKRIIEKVNEKFKGTNAEINVSLGSNEEIPRGDILLRSALITVISEDPELKKLNIWPISPLESEVLIQRSQLPKPTNFWGVYWECLGLTLYDISEKGKNPKEAKALYEDINRNKQKLGLKDSDLEERLLIVNSGLDIDQTFPRGVKPKVIPGVTQVYGHETLKRTGQYHRFNYGLENGLPSVSQLGNGNRTLFMPSENKDIGLRVLSRDGHFDLGAKDKYFDNIPEFSDGDDEDGRITFIRRVT